MFIVFYAKQQHKAEKRGAIYVRRMMEVLFRVQARVYWVNSGHMITDGLTKLSNACAETKYIHVV